MVQLGLLDTFASVILLYSALNLPFNVYLMTAFFRSVPDELIEAPGSTVPVSIERSASCSSRSPSPRSQRS